MATPNSACPVCDNAFTEKEPVLRCLGCGQVLHPGCWVENGGCTTAREHQSRSEPVAWPPPPLGGGARPAPRRIVRGPAAPAPGQPRPGPRRGPPPAAHNTAEQPNAPMPGLYGGGQGILRYWFVPVAVLLSVAVALGVIFVGDMLIGGDDGGSPASPSPSATSVSSGLSTPSPTATPTLAPGVLGVGATAIVVDTGECLNIRDQPTTAGAQVACLVDGTEVTIVDGPIEADGYQWFSLTSDFGTGWGADEYLQPSTPAAQ